MNRALLVGVVHLPALAGSPLVGADVRLAEKRAAEDAKILAEAGFDFVMIENYGDAPFFPGRVPAATVAMMTVCALAARAAAPSVRLGINVLRNDARRRARGCSRSGGGLYPGERPHRRARDRSGSHPGGRGGALPHAPRSRRRSHRGVGRRGREALGAARRASAARRSRGPGLAFTRRGGSGDGEGTGRAVDTAKLDEVHRAVQSRVPVLVASGATIGTLPPLARRSEGVIVGSALRADGVAGGPVDAKRASEFARAFRSSFNV